MSDKSDKRECCKCGNSFALTIEWVEDEDVLSCVCDECGYRWKEAPRDTLVLPKAEGGFDVTSEGIVTKD